MHLHETFHSDTLTELKISTHITVNGAVSKDYVEIKPGENAIEKVLIITDC